MKTSTPAHTLRDAPGLLALALALVALAAPPARAQVDESAPPPDIAALEADLYEARAYREGYPDDKTRSALRTDYRNNDLFREFATLRREAQKYLVDPDGEPRADDDTDDDGDDAYTLGEKTAATLRMQEAANEVLSGQLQLGNEQLLNAGRRKFPSVLSPSAVASVRAPYDERDEWKELALAGLEFEAGIVEGLGALRDVPAEATRGESGKALRSRGGSETINTPAEGFANYTVIDQGSFVAANAHFVRTEMSLLMNLLARRGIASGAMVDRLRRLAFRENNQIEGSQRHGVAGEEAKEDLNRRAIRVAKRDAQLMFYAGLTMRSQLPASPNGIQDDFKLHNGDKLFAAMSQLNILFKDIRDGRLPTGLADQFVPSPNKRIGTAGGQGYLSDAITAVQRARESQQVAEQRVMLYQQGQVSRVELNRNIRESYLTQLGQMTGFQVNATTGILTDPLDPNNTFDLKTPENRKEFLALLEEKTNSALDLIQEDTAGAEETISSLGQIGQAVIQLQQARIGSELAADRITQIENRAGIISERASMANAIVEKFDKAKNVADARFTGIRAGYEATIAFLSTPKNSVNGTTVVSDVGHIMAAIAAAGREYINYEQRQTFGLLEQAEKLEFNNLEADLGIKELMINMNATLLESDLQAVQAVQAYTNLELLLRQIADLVENMSEYRSETADLWFLDPSLEVEKVDAELQADLDLQDCLAVLYDLTRALEFYWTEDFQNPVQDINGGIVTLPNFANEFTEIDDLYAITDANDAEKYLNALGFGLSGGSSAGWESTLRALRQSIPAQNQIVILSLREDILGFAVPERATWPVGGPEVQIHDNGFILPGMEDAYAYYENEAITKFRDELQKGRKTAQDFAFGTGRDPQDYLDGFEFTFTTNDKSAYLFDAREWNNRLQAIAFDIRAEGGFIPPGQEENFVRLNVIQEATVSFRRSFPLELSDAQFDTYQTEFTYESDRLRVSPYEFPVQASVNGSSGPFGGQATVLPYFFSPICSQWRVVLDPLSSLANHYADVDRIKDIRIVLTLRSGIPPTTQEGL